jgi:LacI family transcriptional regulator
MSRNAKKLLEPAEGAGRLGLPRGAVTIKDIASALQVSHSTVSRALNDHTHISAETKERVRQAALELGYVVNAGARTLRQARSRLIGVMVPNVTNELFAVMLKVLAERCQQAGYQIVLGVTNDDPEVELRHVEALRESRAVGVVCVPTARLLPATARLMEAMCVVQFSRSHPLVSASSVAIDGAHGVATAVGHLADLGHERIAYIGLPTDLSTGRMRADGYRGAMEERGLPIRADLCRNGPGTAEFGRAVTSSMLRGERGPTAIIYGSADLTQGGVEAVRREGVVIPKDLSIIGFGDPVWLRLVTPSLSTVGVSLAESADAAISMLLRQIAADEDGLPQQAHTSLELEPFLILRQSTAPPAG